jgi:putative chitobiose transport system substrate-binding protein
VRRGPAPPGRGRPVRSLAGRIAGPALGAALLLPGASCGDDARGARVVTFWTISLRPTFTAYIEERIDAFEAGRPGARVRWVDVPFDSVDRKLLAAAAAGRAPDVVNLSDLMFARYAGAGAFVDLAPLASDEALARFHAGALAVGRLGDRQLALPWYLTTQSLIYNGALLAEGGLAPEDLGRTWSALLDQAGPYHERTGRWLLTQPIGTDSQLPTMLLAEGLAPFAVDDAGLLTADLTRPGVLAFLARWADLYRSGALPREAATRGFEHLIDVYQNERVAVVNTGANFLGRVRDVSRDVYERTGVLPPATGALGAAHIAVMPVCVSAQSGDHALAADWLLFITSPESQSAFCRLAPILPSTPESLDDPFFAGPTDAEIEAGLATVGEARAVVARGLEHAVAFTPALECWPDLRRVFNERFKAVLLDGADLRAEMEACERDWSRIIGRMNDQRTARGGRPAGPEALPAPLARRAGVAQPAGRDG